MKNYCIPLNWVNLPAKISNNTITPSKKISSSSFFASPHSSEERVSFCLILPWKSYPSFENYFGRVLQISVGGSHSQTITKYQIHPHHVNHLTNSFPWNSYSSMTTLRRYPMTWSPNIKWHWFGMDSFEADVTRMINNHLWQPLGNVKPWRGTFDDTTMILQYELYDRKFPKDLQQAHIWWHYSASNKLARFTSLSIGDFSMPSIVCCLLKQLQTTYLINIRFWLSNKHWNLTEQ